MARRLNLAEAASSKESERKSESSKHNLDLKKAGGGKREKKVKKIVDSRGAEGGV